MERKSFFKRASSYSKIADDHKGGAIDEAKIKSWSFTELTKQYERTNIQYLALLEEELTARCPVWVELRKLAQPIGVYNLYRPLTSASALLNVDLHLETNQFHLKGTKLYSGYFRMSEKKSNGQKLVLRPQFSTRGFKCLSIRQAPDWKSPKQGWIVKLRIDRKTKIHCFIPPSGRVSQVAQKSKQTK